MGEVTFNFKGKNFVVIGASSGIGKQVAIELLNAGANVLAVARRKDLMDEIYKNYSSQVVTVKMDVTNFDGWNDIFKPFVSEKGKFHGSVYCAGIGMPSSIRSIEIEELQKVMNTNFFGAVMFMKKFIRAANVNPGSSNVWISSLASYIGTRGLTAYEASKGAMMSAKRSLACEISNQRHRLNTVSPAWVETPLASELNDTLFGIDRTNRVSKGYPLGRIGQPEDISGMILFLLSERSSWMTGSDIIIDGGALAVGGGISYEMRKR